MFARFESGGRSRYFRGVLGAEGHHAFQAARGLALSPKERDRVEVQLDRHVEQRQDQSRAPYEVVRTDLVPIVHLYLDGIAALDEAELTVRPADGLPLRAAVPLDHLVRVRVRIRVRVRVRGLEG